MDRKYFSGVVFVALLFWLAADFAAWHRLSCLSEGKPTGDLAMFEEIYAAARHGTLFAGREASGPVYPRVHVAPVLALAFPPYLLNPAGGMLRIIVLENLGLALAGIVLFLLVRRSLSARGGAWLCLAFFTHLTVTSPLVVTEVQPLKWAPLFLLLLLVKVEDRGAGYAALATCWSWRCGRIWG